MHSEKLPSKKQFKVIKMIAAVKEPKLALGKVDYSQFKKIWKALFVTKRAYKFVCSKDTANGVSIVSYGNTWEDAVTGKVTSTDMNESGIECDECEDDDYEGDGDQFACIVSDDDVGEFLDLAE